MNKLYQDILLHQFLEGLYQKIGIEINKLDTEKSKGNKHFELLIREENAKATIADLNKIGRGSVLGDTGRPEKEI